MALTCNNCDAEFTARRGAKYCSPRCRTEAHRIRTGTKGVRRRVPLPDAFFSTVYDLGRKSESLERLVRDDRFQRNAKAVSHHKSDLLRVRDRLEVIIDQLPDA